MKTQSGFTLVELMVTLAVGIIILAIGVPSFMSMMSTNQAAGYANDLVGAIRLARSEAVKRGSDVTICASNSDQTACDSNNWNNGWIVFSDDNDSGSLDAGETIHRVWSIPSDERGNLVFASASPNSIRYTASGSTSSAMGAITFKKSDCYASQARQISFTPLGRATLDLVTCF